MGLRRYSAKLGGQTSTALLREPSASSVPEHSSRGISIRYLDISAWCISSTNCSCTTAFIILPHSPCPSTAFPITSMCLTTVRAGCSCRPLRPITRPPSINSRPPILILGQSNCRSKQLVSRPYDPVRADERDAKGMSGAGMRKKRTAGKVAVTKTMPCAMAASCRHERGKKPIDDIFRAERATPIHPASLRRR
ncbi:hypothetical protein OH77DRAFT_877509 [Trametes cingulata]|nr:hypothetical protein OH77DRAFT_877509 [Trametes cingulata]